MPLEEIIAGIILLSVIIYGVLGGADFGGGIWDIFATGARKDAQRAAIAKAIGPVWEANHVWLIFIIVLLFTAFPFAFYALSIGLFIPFHLVLIGITLRGAAFVFRAYGSKTDSAQHRWGTVFGAASIITPVLLGMSLGAVSAGSLRVINGEIKIEGDLPWFAPISIAIGVLALALCSYLAAVYLTNETTADLQEDFRRRALLAGTVVVGLAVLTMPLIYYEARHLWSNLVSFQVMPIIIQGVVAALFSGWGLLTRRYQLARFATIVQVSLLLAGWGMAQYPYIIYPDVTLHDAAAPIATLKFLLYTLPIGMVLLVPSLWFLFIVFKGNKQSTTHN
ncbi:MAG: cytochrome d ubiquinol oxidase subunit II [Acidobacteriota bacterium]